MSNRGTKNYGLGCLVMLGLFLLGLALPIFVVAQWSASHDVPKHKVEAKTVKTPESHR